ncbi:MAG: RNA polymerase subunit sigma [Lysobacteraceae bacterium SCN 69-123]|nr:MAG: RNA polymerase subunit sigma [Xanthomonadaceae bacterium SCN 69-123]
MRRFAAGDVGAFEQLYSRHKGGLMRFLQRGLGRRETAEECFQEVWSRVIAARDRYQPEARFATWLYQIANNLLIDQYRRQRPELNVETLPEEAEPIDNPIAPAPALSPEDTVGAFEEARRLQQALAELPDEQRIAVQLRLEQELSLEEIGAITGAGRETVKSRLRYALDKLKDRLRR